MKTISGKLQALYLTVVAGTLLLTFLALEYRFSLTTHESLDRELRDITFVSEPDISMAVWELDELALAKAMAQIEQTVFVQGVLVVDQNGDAIRSVGQIRDVGDDDPHRKSIQLTSTAFGQPETIGRLYVFGTDEHLWNQFFDRLMFQGLVVLVVISALSIVVQVSTRRLIRAPLEDVRNAAAAMAAGNRLARARPDGEDEVAEMGRAFNAMADTLIEHERRMTMLSKVFMDSTDPITILDPDGIVLEVNSQAERSYGWPAGELVGAHISKVVPAQYHDASRELLEKCMRGEPVQNIQGVAQHRDGTRIDILNTISALRDESGHIVAIASHVKDISDLKQAERGLQRQAHELSERVKELDCLFALSNILDERGLSVRSLVERSITVIASGWQYPEIVCARIVLDDMEVTTDGFRLTEWHISSPLTVAGAKRGRIEVCYLEEMPTRYEGPFVEEERKLIDDFARRLGNAIERREVWESVARARAELETRVEERTAELRASEERARAIVDNATDGVIVIDDKGVIQSFSPAAERIFQYTANEVVGQNVSVLMPDPYRLEHDGYLANYLQGAEPKVLGRTREMEGLRKDGEVFPIDLSVGKAELDEGVIFAGVVRDISPRKVIERELIEAKDTAEQASAAKASFLATMSHEIRTPMNAVITLADILNETQLTPDQSDMARTIRQSSRALLAIIDDILDFSKIEAGRLIIEHMPFHLMEPVWNVADVIVPRAEAKELLLTVDIEPGLPEQVIGDPTRLQQILMNLAGNAVKFTASGQVAIRVAIVDRGDAQCRIRFEVVDTGIGISQEQISLLFQPFSQAESSTTRRFGGTGLGLAICHQLVSMMDGEIGIETKEGEGSTFWFELPYAVQQFDRFTAPYDFSTTSVIVAGFSPDESASIVRLLEAGNVASSRILDQIDADVPNGPHDLIILSGRPGTPTVLEWARMLGENPETHGTAAIISAPHASRSALGIDAGMIRGLRFLRTMTAPMNPVRLWQMIAVGNGQLPESVLQTDMGVAETFIAPSPEAARTANAMVLVAEDNPTNRDVISRVLGRMGIAFEMVEDGADALSAIKARKFDLLLTDFHMPRMDGFQLTAKIREDETADGTSPRLAVVALTADVLPETEQKCREVGMDGYLRKPLELDRLEAVLRHHVPAAFELRTPEATNLAATAREPAAQEPDQAASAPSAGSSPIDPAALKDVFGDDDEIFREILNEFVEPANANVQEILEACRNRSAEGVRAAAHKLKSSARSVGAHALADTCFELERAGGSEDWNTVDASVPRLPDLMMDVSGYVKALG